MRPCRALKHAVGSLESGHNLAAPRLGIWRPEFESLRAHSITQRLPVHPRRSRRFGPAVPLQHQRQCQHLTRRRRIAAPRRRPQTRRVQLRPRDRYRHRCRFQSAQHSEPNTLEPLQFTVESTQGTAGMSPELGPPTPAALSRSLPPDDSRPGASALAASAAPGRSPRPAPQSSPSTSRSRTGRGTAAPRASGSRPQNRRSPSRMAHRGTVRGSLA